MNETNNDFEVQNDSKGWIANVLSSVSTSFNKFIAIFKKNGLLYSLLMMLIFIIFWCFIIHPININTIVQKQLENQWNKEVTHNINEKNKEEEKRMLADDLLTPLVENIVEKFGVDRVLLFELHNGTKNINGTSFIFFSCTYEAIYLDNYDLEYIGDNFQRQYANQMLGEQIISTLQHKDYITFNDISDYKRNRSRLLIKLKKFNANNVMIIPIKDGNNKILSILCVTNKSSIDSDLIYEYVKPFIPQVQSAL